MGGGREGGKGGGEEELTGKFSDRDFFKDLFL